MKILLTGGSGFLGQNLLSGLQNKFDILAPARKELDLTDGVAVREYLENNKIKGVIHAAVSSAVATDRDAGFVYDLQMLSSLTSNIQNLDKIIVFGSGAEFAKTRDLIKVEEEEWGKYVPHDLYGLSKYLTQEIVKREPKMINLRLFGVYGPHEDYLNKFISNSIVKKLMGIPIRIIQDVKFDYLYVDDLVAVVEHFLTHKNKYRDYNVTPTNSIKLSEIINIVNNNFDKHDSIKAIYPDLNNEYTGCNKRLVAELPKLTFTSYETGIMRLVLHYKKILSTLDIQKVKQDIYYRQSQKRI